MLVATSVGASRAALVPAFAGTVVGAALAGVLLAVIGADTTAYAWILPPVMLVALVVGPLLGLAAGQGGFTLIVAMPFAQLAPASWKLTGVRLVDVVVGGLVGAADRCGDLAARVGPLGRLFDITYGQFRSEPEGRSANLDWLAVGGVAHRLADDVATLRGRYPGNEPCPPPSGRPARHERRRAGVGATGHAGPRSGSGARLG